MEQVSVRFDRKIGPMKPVHGVNNGPKTRMFSLDMSRYFRDAGIPYARLHDTEYPYGSGHFVDIPCVFPDFSADPADPGAYDFTLTDQYIEAIVAVGTQVFYRLGVSIEHARKKYEIFPPEDYAKWAQICIGIIRHYTEGWADGYRYPIEYWEIWNEPENPPMWQGTKEQYFELYATAAQAIKARFPHLKVGGYAGCGFYALTRDNQSDFYKGFVTYFTDFLAFVSASSGRIPLDFYSWHLYTTRVAEMAAHADYVRQTLDRFGFTGTESIINEWNYVHADPDRFKRMKKMEAAAFDAAVLCALQSGPVDMGNYYDAQPNMRYCGLFDYEEAKKPYYAFYAFNCLYRLQKQTETKCAEPAVYACAAANDSEAAVLIAMQKETSGKLLIDMAGFCSDEGVEAEFYMLDETFDLELVRSETFFSTQFKSVLDVTRDAVVLIKLRRASK